MKFKPKPLQVTYASSQIPTNHILNKNITYYRTWSRGHAPFGNIAFHIKVTVRNTTRLPPAIIKSNISRQIEKQQDYQYSTGSQSSTVGMILCGYR